MTWRGIALALLAVVGSQPAWTQYEDDQTSDHEQQDRRYYERYVESAEQQPEAQAEPDDEPEDIREAFLAVSEEAIRDKNYRSWDSPGYRVQTDDPRVDTKAAVALLDAFGVYFDEFWDDRLEMQEYDETSRVFLFWSFRKFNDVVGGRWSRSDLRPSGHYRESFDAITVHSDPGGVSALGDVLVHEAAHQLNLKRIYGGVRPSLWIGEGLASYFGYTLLDRETRFETGLIGGKSVAIIRGTPPGASSEARVRLTDFRKGLSSSKKKGTPPNIIDVIYMRDAAEFYGGNPQRNYSASWLVIHYLLHGEDGRHADTFAQYLELDRNGRGGPEMLLSGLGMTATELDAAVAGYVKKLKAR